VSEQEPEDSGGPLAEENQTDELDEPGVFPDADDDAVSEAPPGTELTDEEIAGIQGSRARQGRSAELGEADEGLS
jgi:hypothetical protein